MSTAKTGAPRDCYLRPASPEAAWLLGETNVFDAMLHNGRAATPFGLVFVAGRNGPVRVMTRPEGLVIGPEGDAARVLEVAFMGATSLLRVERDGVEALARVAGASPAQVGDEIRIRLDPAYCAVAPA